MLSMFQSVPVIAYLGLGSNLGDHVIGVHVIAIRDAAGALHQPMARESQVDYRSGQKDKDTKKA